MLICPECAYEWSSVAAVAPSEQQKVVRDAHGNELHDGDAVTAIKVTVLTGRILKDE